MEGLKQRLGRLRSKGPMLKVFEKKKGRKRDIYTPRKGEKRMKKKER